MRSVLGERSLRGRRALLTSSVLVLGLLSAPELSVAQADHGPPIAVLGSRTTLTGGGPGYVELRVPADVMIDLRVDDGEIAGFQAEGGSSATGMLLTTRDRATRPGPVYLAMAMPDDFQAIRESSVTSLPGGGRCDVCPLPRGDYRLYLLADGPAEVTLDVAGPVGRKVEYAASPIAADIQSPKASDFSLPNDAGRLWSAAAAGELTTPGALISLSYFEGPANEAANVIAFGSCSYDGDGPPLGVAIPGCPGGSHKLGGLLNRIQTDYGVARVELVLPVATGSSGMGAYADVVGASGTFGMTGIWLNLEPS